MLASENGHKSVVDFLLGAGAEVNEAANDGQTALFVAAHHGQKDVIRTLIRQRSDITTMTRDGQTIESIVDADTLNFIHNQKKYQECTCYCT